MRSTIALALSYALGADALAVAPMRGVRPHVQAVTAAQRCAAPEMALGLPLPWQSNAFVLSSVLGRPQCF